MEPLSWFAGHEGAAFGAFADVVEGDDDGPAAPQQLHFRLLIGCPIHASWPVRQPATSAAHTLVRPPQNASTTPIAAARNMNTAQCRRRLLTGAVSSVRAAPTRTPATSRP